MTGTPHDPTPPIVPRLPRRTAADPSRDAIPVSTHLDLTALEWRTSTYSNRHHPDELQVAMVPGGGVAIRNGAFPDRAVVTCSHRAWNALAQAFMVGENLVRL